MFTVIDSERLLLLPRLMRLQSFNQVEAKSTMISWNCLSAYLPRNWPQQERYNPFMTHFLWTDHTINNRQVTAVLPLFPYSRQSDIPYHKTGAPPFKACESTSQTPHPDQSPTAGLINGMESLNRGLARPHNDDSTTNASWTQNARFASYNGHAPPKRSNTMNSTNSETSTRQPNASMSSTTNGAPNEDEGHTSKDATFQPQPGYKQWVAQSGTLVADLITCAGADHVITMDLHDPQYQGFLDIPVDNLYARPILKRYIETSIPNYQQAIVVSPDAGGAKRASAIADGLGMSLGLIHKVRVIGGLKSQRQLIATYRSGGPPKSLIDRLQP